MGLQQTLHKWEVNLCHVRLRDLGIVCYYSTVYLTLTNTLPLGLLWGLNGSIAVPGIYQGLSK